MKLASFTRAADGATEAPAAGPPGPAFLVCLQCGVRAARADQTFCRRCGLPYGAPPRPDAVLPICPICYREVEEDGRLPAHSGTRRLDLAAHMHEHERYPVGDDEYLESLRVGDRIRIGRGYAPFELVRRYLVTGVVDAGRRRSLQHTTVLTALTQLARWGSGATIVGDQAEWAEARAEVAELMERYHRGPARERSTRDPGRNTGTHKVRT